MNRIKTVAKDLQSAYQNWQQDDGSHLAASVSFYMAVSFFPLLLVLLSALGLVLRFSGWGHDAQQQLLELVGNQTAPALAEKLKLVLTNVQDRSAIGGPIGLFTLFFAAMAVFVHFDDAINRVWNVSPSSKKGMLAGIRGVLIDRFRAFLMLIGVALLVIAGFIASMALSVAGRYADDWLPMPGWVWASMTLVVAVGLNWLLFTIVYKILPKMPVAWSEAAHGALFASILWEVGRRLLATLVIGSKFSVYGVVGAFVAILLWVFYATTVLFLGAEYIQVICARCNPSSD